MISFSFFIRFCHYNKQFCDSQVEHFSDSWGRQKHFTDEWEFAINCSMHSQDIYYDYLCARETIKEKGRFNKCFIIFGYYIAFQDLSLSKNSRETMIRYVYYPVFNDSHNWEEPTTIDLWRDNPEINEKEKAVCELIALRKISEKDGYYSDAVPRRPYFDLKGNVWTNISDEEKELFGKRRAEDHNRLSTHESSLTENKEILKEFIHFLNMYETKPIIVIPPFTDYYNRYVNQRSREGVEELIKNVTDKFEFIDFNKEKIFDDSDFVDTDHLNVKGAEKFSQILVDLYGD